MQIQLKPILIALSTHILLLFLLYRLLVYQQTHSIADSWLGNLPPFLLLFIPLNALAGTLGYLFLNWKYPKSHLQKYSFALSNLLLGLGVAVLFFSYHKSLTLTSALVLIILLFSIEYWGKLRFMYKAYRSIALLLLFDALAYFVLLPAQVATSPEQTIMGLKIMAAPIEWYWLNCSAQLVGLYVLEYLTSKNKA